MKLSFTKIPPLFLRIGFLLISLATTTTVFSSSNIAKDEIDWRTKVTGTVVSAVDNSPLPGVTVLESGTTNGVITDADGHYSIEVSGPNAVIKFSYIGFETVEVPLGGRSTLDVTLEESTTVLDEMVVVGYGSKVKGELTGAISKADETTFEKRSLTNSISALQGSLPGVNITRGSGRPGEENYALQIRGTSSISGNKALVLIDGIQGDLNLLNPNDIESVTVLKDASAAIYGARAADGVILVTTKQGKIGKPRITYSGNFGIKLPQFLKKRTNTLQYAEMYDEGMRNVGLPGVSDEVFEKIRSNAAPDPSGWLKYLENFPGFYGSHDWNDDVYGNGTLQSHNLSISGGGDNSNYLLSAGYVRNEGIFKHGENHSDRYNLRLNYNVKLFDWLDIETRTSFEDLGNIEPTGLNSILYFVNQMGSYVPIHNPQGQLYKYQGGFRNPIQFLEESGQSKSNTYRLSTNFKANIQVMDNLQMVTQVGVNYDFYNSSSTNPSFNEYNWDGSLFGVRNSPNSASYINSRNSYKLFTTYLDYSKDFSKKHQLNLMLGTSHEENDLEGQSITGHNFASNEIFTLNLADRSKSEYATFSGNASDWALQSYFGRLSYSFDGKYLVDVTTRIDGSSKFAPDKRWSALFPSVAFAWNISREPFFASIKSINNLKLRASWGQTGNQELSSFGNYDYISLITITSPYPLGSPNSGLPGAVPNIPSSQRTWETIETSNIGLDFYALDSRLNGSFDFYVKNNNNMLVNDQLPATLGGTAPAQNIGKLRTRGWDFSIGWSDHINDFRYSITGILSDSKNKLLELKGNDSYGEGLNYTREGYSLNSYFGYEFEGIISNEEQLNNYRELGNIPANLSLGDAMFKDIDGDGKITAFGDPALGTTGDMVYLGNLMPRYTYSTNINIGYKAFDLRIFLQGVGKRKGIRTGELAYPLVAVWMEPLEYYHGKSWTPENVDAPYPRIIPGQVGFDELRAWNWRTSSMRMVNLAYLKVKVISLAYNLPASFCSKAKLTSARVYLSGEDLFTFAKDTWNNSFSPEETWERSDEQTYPFSGVISAGVEINF